MTSFCIRLPGQLAAGGRGGATACPIRAAAQTLGCRLIYNSSKRAALSAPELIRISVIKGGPDPTSLSSDLLKGPLEVVGGSDCLPTWPFWWECWLFMCSFILCSFVHSFNVTH